MLHGVAVVFHAYAIGRGVRQFVHQCDVGHGLTEWSDVGLASQAESVRLSIVRRSENDERAVLVRGQQRRVGVAVGFPSAERADVRRSDPDLRVLGPGGRARPA